MMWPWNRIKELEEQLAMAMEITEETKQETIKVPVPCTCKEDLQALVSDKAKLHKDITDLEKQRLEAVRKFKEAEQDHKIVIEDIKHMQRILDEKNALELDRKIFEGEKNAESEIKKIRKEYSDKLEKELMIERNKMQEFMQRVMDALPNVNVRMKG